MWGQSCPEEVSKEVKGEIYWSNWSLEGKPFFQISPIHATFLKTWNWVLNNKRYDTAGNSKQSVYKCTLQTWFVFWVGLSQPTHRSNQALPGIQSQEKINHDMKRFKEHMGITESKPGTRSAQGSAKIGSCQIWSSLPSGAVLDPMDQTRPHPTHVAMVNPIPRSPKTRLYKIERAFCVGLTNN